MKLSRHLTLKSEGKRNIKYDRQAEAEYWREPPIWLETSLRQTLRDIAESRSLSPNAETVMLARLLTEMENSKRKKYSWRLAWSWLGAAAIVMLVFLSFFSPWMNEQNVHQMAQATPAMSMITAPAPGQRLDASTAVSSAYIGHPTAWPAMDVYPIATRGATFPAGALRTGQHN